MSDTSKNPMFQVPAGTGEESNKTPKVDTASKAEDQELDQPYDDISSVTISLVQNFSLYRKVNSKVLPKRVDYIGSSIISSQKLAANKKEVETYFPNLIGLSPNNDKFVTEVKIWLGNIRIAVDELGKTFDTSFHYHRKRDYIEFAKRMEQIEADYAKVNRNNLEALKKALEIKINLINSLESEKCTLGYPIKLEEYLMYRHCLLYKDVAKDLALINSDNNIRFYFKDDAKEAERERKFHEQLRKANTNLASILSDVTMFEAVYIQYCKLNNLPVINNLAQSDIKKERELMDYSQKEPIKFNKICTNPNVKTMAEIEKLIARGELVQSEFNQQISTSEGVIIGANMNEAVAWFKNVENTSVVNAYRAKLKNS